MDVDQFRDTLNLRIRAALDSAAASRDVRDEEPWLVRIVDLIRANPNRRPEAVEILEGLVQLLGDVHCPAGLVEMLGYCVHTLNLPDVVAAAEARRQAALTAWNEGIPGGFWDQARRCERVIAAANPNWEERELFPGLANDTRG